MAQVLFSRNLRLDVALTFWRKRSKSELVAYLARMEDLGRCNRLSSCAHGQLTGRKAIYLTCLLCILVACRKSLLKSKFE
jgi:hypothetical protein